MGLGILVYGLMMILLKGIDKKIISDIIN
jgi:hypothetical protein